MQNTGGSHQQNSIPRATKTDAIRSALSWPVMKRSLTVMLIIGTILNLINQGDVLLSSGSLNWWKVVLTYCVPFCVASYGAYCAFCVATNTDKERD